jgi:hypothetical protein
MRLANFIRENSTPIIAEWESFAATLAPASESASPLTLRNHIKFILNFIADDIDSLQTDTEQFSKSRGDKAKSPINSVAEIHAALRQAGASTWIRWSPNIARFGRASSNYGALNSRDPGNSTWWI